MRSYEFLFGDKFERCIEYIIVEAYKLNTREAYTIALHKLAGLRTFCIFLSSEGGVPMPSAILLLRTHEDRLNEIIRSEKGCLEKSNAKA